LDEFKENIKSNSFLAISMSADIVLTTKLMKQFPDNVFHIIHEPPVCWSLGEFVEVSKEKNVARGSFLVSELINHIKKVIQLEKTSQSGRRHGVN